MNTIRSAVGLNSVLERRLSPQILNLLLAVYSHSNHIFHYLVPHHRNSCAKYKLIHTRTKHSVPILQAPRIGGMCPTSLRPGVVSLISRIVCSRIHGRSIRLLIRLRSVVCCDMGSCKSPWHSVSLRRSDHHVTIRSICSSPQLAKISVVPSAAVRLRLRCVPRYNNPPQ